MKRILAAGVALLVLGAGLLLVLRDRPAPAIGDAPAETPAVARTAPPAAGPAPPREPAADPAPVSPAPRRAPAPKKADPAPAPAEPAAPTLATLVLDSDVRGASVFINREYVGTTPLRLDRLDPGPKQLKLAADGYEGIERTVDLAPGDNPVTMRFREVRLNTRIAVTHKHGMGSCEGALVATIDGLAYETANRSDAFRLSYDQIETFTVDYLDKNLRVKQRGGRTWNFTDRAAANADALFVFHRDVEAARKKLADGYTAIRD